MHRKKIVRILDFNILVDNLVNIYLMFKEEFDVILFFIKKNLKKKL